MRGKMKNLWHQRKVYLAYLLWLVGLRRILPSGIVNKKRVCENASPLVDISRDDTFSFDARAMKRGGLWVRAELIPMLHAAARALPAGYKLHFFGGWRSMTVQWTAWWENLENKRRIHADLPEMEIERIARMTSADPSRGGYGPHQTGGAIDLTVVDAAVRELDMGTPFSYHGTECQTFYRRAAPAASENRMILYRAMKSAGFQNYPGEWWHWSYGDRAWAAYKRRRAAIFGRTGCKDYVITPDEIKLLAKHGIKLNDGE